MHILPLVLWVLGSKSGCESAPCRRLKQGRQASKGRALRPQRRLLGGEEVMCEWGPEAEHSFLIMEKGSGRLSEGQGQKLAGVNVKMGPRMREPAGPGAPRGRGHRQLLPS